jgi:pyridoxamine 5'-phosphate oxidase
MPSRTTCGCTLSRRWVVGYCAAMNMVPLQMADDPLVQFHRWFKQAQPVVRLPECMALATADAAGKSSVRFVLLKQADERGFVFYTNARSPKGQDLRARPHASAAFYWDPIGKQVRLEGRVEEVSAAEADEYWSTRARPKQLGTLASEQSAPLANRAALVARWKALRKKFRGRAIPRPTEWTGYRIVPRSIEFWTRRPARLHVRELFVRTRSGWKRTLLQP